MIFFFKQKTAYEMRISDWSSDVCSSDLITLLSHRPAALTLAHPASHCKPVGWLALSTSMVTGIRPPMYCEAATVSRSAPISADQLRVSPRPALRWQRSEERRVGKRVTVRVDLGGSRFIKKQPSNNKT